VKQIAKLIEQKKNPKQPKTCNSNNQPQEKNKEKKLLVWFFWVGSQNTFTCVVCFFHITFERAWTLIILFSEMLKISKESFFGNEKSFFL